MRRPSVSPAAVAVLLSACAAQAAPVSSSCTARAAPPPHAAAGPFLASAGQAVVAPGATVAFTVTATGPASFTAPCSGPLQLFVADDTTLRVYAAASATGPASPCGAVSLVKGKRDVYAVTWQVDPTLPPGPYTATLLLGDQPALTLTVKLASSVAGCSS